MRWWGRGGGVEVCILILCLGFSVAVSMDDDDR